jgi:hypothetical protein
MAIIVEDGTGLTNSNSYASEAELLNYATARGIALTATEAVLLVQAMDYLEGRDFIGEKFSEAQSLQWPRYNAWVDNFLIGSDAIPQLLKDAQCEAAIAVDAGTGPLATIERAVKREKVDVIEVEYMDNANQAPYLRALATKLRKLIKGGGSIRSVRV